MVFSLLRPLTIQHPPKELSGVAAWVETSKPILPIPVVLLAAWLLWFLFFRNTWRELDQESLSHRAKLLATGKTDRRPWIALPLCALILTMQEYYGGRAYFDLSIYPLLTKLDGAHAWMKLTKYDELYGFAWWAGTRIGGYCAPFLVWKLFFRTDSLLDLGLRTKGFFDHVWIYFLFFGFVVLPMFIVAKSPDFGAYYPFYKTAHRSWFDFLVWEAMYFAQFFALEMFFRGFWLGTLRKSFGSGAIFVMAVPYCMIHYGKPYLEAAGAILAGIALGSLSMRTKSIYQGFLVHITIAAMMDWLSLRHRHSTPLYLFPTDATVPSQMNYAAQEQAREALAVRVETTAVIIFSLIIVFLFVMMLRAHRLKGRRI